MQKIRCREISKADIESVAGLLTRGFVRRLREYWVHRQAAREVPEGYPASVTCSTMMAWRSAFRRYRLQ
jgi:hypothetical protein